MKSKLSFIALKALTCMVTFAFLILPASFANDTIHLRPFGSLSSNASYFDSLPSWIVPEDDAAYILAPAGPIQSCGNTDGYMRIIHSLCRNKT